MNEQIKFSYKDTDYTLEFNRKSVQALEEDGFRAKDVQEKPVTAFSQLFKFSFLVHHKFVKNALIDEIYNNISNKKKLNEKLMDMYVATMNGILDNDPESEKNENLIDWE